MIRLDSSLPAANKGSGDGVSAGNRAIAELCVLRQLAQRRETEEMGKRWGRLKLFHLFLKPRLPVYHSN